jgi:hypothetical protein
VLPSSASASRKAASLGRDESAGLQGWAPCRSACAPSSPHRRRLAGVAPVLASTKSRTRAELRVAAHQHLAPPASHDWLEGVTSGIAASARTRCTSSSTSLIRCAAFSASVGSRGSKHAARDLLRNRSCPRRRSGCGRPEHRQHLAKWSRTRTIARGRGQSCSGPLEHLVEVSDRVVPEPSDSALTAVSTRRRPASMASSADQGDAVAVAVDVDRQLVAFLIAATSSRAGCGLSAPPCP